MLRIPIVPIAVCGLVLAVFWYGMPIWTSAISVVVHWPRVQGFLIGFMVGLAVPVSIGYNMGLRLRRDQTIDRAEQDYERDRRRWRK